MVNFARNFSSDDSGATAPLFAICCTVLLILAGGAIDFGRAYAMRQDLQTATDAAALAAAMSDTDRRLSAATDYFETNFKRGIDPSTAFSENSVTVSATMRVPTTLLNVIGISEVPVTATSEAIVPAAPATAGTCIFLMHPSAIGLYADSDSGLNADCGLQINSSDKEALFANSFSTVVTTKTCVHGLARLNSGSSANPTPVERCLPASDPLAALPEPTSGTCNHTDFTVNNDETRSMTPGVYCGKTLVNSGGTAVMQAGQYTFRGGEFEINASASVSGSEVIMYFVGAAARLNVNSGSTLSVTAPKTGDYAGVLMFQGRDADNASAPPFIVNSNSSSKLEGTIYLPRGTLEANSLSGMNQTATYTAIVAQQMILNSGGVFNVNSDYQSNTPLPPVFVRAVNAKRVRLAR